MRAHATTGPPRAGDTPFRTAWAYLQRELIFLSWSLMEVSLFTPFALAIMPWAANWPPSQVFLWLWLVTLLSFNLARLMGLLLIPRDRQRQVMVIGLILTVLVSLPTLLYRPASLFDWRWLVTFYENVDESTAIWARDLTVFLITVFIWWRGIRLSVGGLTIQRAGLRLRLGGLVLAPLVIWAGRNLSWNVTPFILLFFLAGLIAVALVRAEEVERSRTGHSVSLNPRWLAVVLVASLALVFTAALLTALVSGNAPLLVAGWLAPLWSAASFAGATVANTVAFLAEPLLLLMGLFIQLISFLLRQLLSLAAFQGLSLPTFEIATPEATAEAIKQVESAFDGGRAITLLLMLAIVLLVALSLGRLYRQAGIAAREEAAIAGEGGQRIPSKAGFGQRLLNRLGLGRQWRTARSIRRVYQAMCRAAEASGHPRAPSETPYEYLPTLAKVWPGYEAEGELITQAYVKVRYGEIPETKAEVDEILEAWRRLEETQPVTSPAFEPHVKRRL